MAWTYNNSLASDKDRLRFMIGDTDSDDQLLQDEELAYLVTLNTAGSVVNLYGAGAQAALALSAKYAGLADKDIEGYRVSYSQKSKGFANLADRLIAAGSAVAGGAGDVGPSATGISLGNQVIANSDTDRREGDSRQGMFDNGPTDTGSHSAPYRGVIK